MTPPRAVDAVVALDTLRSRLIAYYEQAGPDFAQWSAGFNMHFGYFRRGLNPLNRESMLNELNRQVLTRLARPTSGSGTLVDLGCGVGATARYAASMFPAAEIIGITVVPWQAETGNAWNRRVGIYPRARLELRDYTGSGFAEASVDGAYAIESACHAEGPDKPAFVREAARILRPGARLVVADAFLKHPGLDPLSRRLLATLCRSFVLPELGQIHPFAEALRRHGFTDVIAEEISWRVAPSALHAPVAVLWFVIKKAARGEPFTEWRVNNLRGSLVSALLGVNRRSFGYYLVTATRA